MDGIIVINKPENYTSHDIVNIVRKNLKIRKVGHTGTLDPSATGVLPLLIGDATKLSKYLMNHDKEYEVILKLGVKTDTADSEGKVICKKSVNVKNEYEVTNIIKEFKGKQEQIPPIYSAIKVNGKKLYEYAREGKSIDIKPRQIEIYDIQVLSINCDEISFRVGCSKGTYIRSLCEDIAQKLGTVGYMKKLNRIKVGKFNIEDSISIEELSNETIVKEKIITIEKFFEKEQSIKLYREQLEKFLNGVSLYYKDYINGIYNIYNERNQYIGVGIIENNKLKRDIILTNNFQ